MVLSTSKALLLGVLFFILIASSPEHCETGTNGISILKMTKLKHRKIIFPKSHNKFKIELGLKHKHHTSRAGMQTQIGGLASILNKTLRHFSHASRRPE